VLARFVCVSGKPSPPQWRRQRVCSVCIKSLSTRMPLSCNAMLLPTVEQLPHLQPSETTPAYVHGEKTLLHDSAAKILLSLLTLLRTCSCTYATQTWPSQRINARRHMLVSLDPSIQSLKILLVSLECFMCVREVKPSSS
jgi:hypothetical protein